MTAEAPKPGKELPLPVENSLLSPKTGLVAARVEQDLLQKKLPNEELTATLVDSIADDVQKEGLKVSQDDRARVKQQVKDLWQQARRGELPPANQVELEKTLPNVDLNEYYRVMENLFTTYDLGKGSWQAISGFLSTNYLISDLFGAYQIKLATNKDFQNAALDNVTKGLEALGGTDKSVAQLSKTLLEPTNPKLREASKFFLKAGWPFLGPVVQFFVEQRVGKVIGDMRLKERGKLQDAVNGRIAQSLFMRNFEFLHDMPAGELIQIINDGKEATLSLVDNTFTGFIPTIFSVIGQLPRQAVVGKMELLSSAIKIPFMLGEARKRAKLLQLQHANELVEFDKVNTQLMTTLTGLESARVGGDAMSGAEQLFATLGKRDFIAEHGLRTTVRRDRKMNLLFNVMDLGFPILSELWQYKQSGENPLQLTGNEALQDGTQALFRVLNAKGQQGALRGDFGTLTSLYVSAVRDIQDIKRMEEVLGNYDELDLPDGPKEMERMSVRALPKLDITIDNVGYKHILEDVSLSIPQGSFYTIKGESGTGKTTFIRNLVGLYNPDRGAVKVGGVPIEKIQKYGPEAFSTIVGYANQNPQILEGMTLKENLLLWSQKHVTDTVIEQTLRDLKLDHLIGRLDDTTKHFSGGEKRRIGIARALLKNPKILVLDEPTAELDEGSAKQVMSIVEDLRRKRPEMTVIAITHDPIFETIAENIVDFEKLNSKALAKGRGKVELGDNQVFSATATAK